MARYARKKHGRSRNQRVSPRRPQEVGDTSASQATQTSSKRVTPDATQSVRGGQIQSNAPPHHSGDSCSLSYIIEMVYRPTGGSAEPLEVHYPIPASIADRSVPNHESRTEELMVSLREAFTMPARDIADRLIRAFFDIIHPAYPVFDRKNFTRLYHQGQASPLVLQTIFLLGFTVGSQNLVHEAGYSDRATARKTHYLRAKALYDADYENDLTIVVASLLLLGFWWAGPEDQKDSCYWVGCAATLAQSLGMHCLYAKPIQFLEAMLTSFELITASNEPANEVFAEANLVVNICNLPGSRNFIFSNRLM